ncbi:MAG: metal-sulfur cluster assembly factor [Alphaproteobacteria bacterium]|nr:metal-sulfur cluster assembly factor [Alphaproteobacteria bacterium]
MINKEQIIAAIKTVFDPEVPVNVWDLGLIYDIKISDSGHVKIKMTMTSPTCPMSEEIMQMVKFAVASVVGVDGVDIELVWNPPWDISRMSTEARLELDLTEDGW